MVKFDIFIITSLLKDLKIKNQFLFYQLIIKYEEKGYH